MPATRPQPATDTASLEDALPVTQEPMEPDDPIGAALRRLHEQVVSEPIPDAFLALIAEIDSKIEGRT